MEDDACVNSNLIRVERPAFNNTEFEDRFRKKKLKSDNAIKNAAHYCSKNYRPTSGCLKNYFLERLPIINWIRTYNFKENIVSDTIAGLTIGIIHIPQGLHNNNKSLLNQLESLLSHKSVTIFKILKINTDIYF